MRTQSLYILPAAPNHGVLKNVCPVLVFCLDSVTYKFMEGAQSQHLGVALVCGKVGEFTISLNVTSDAGTATGMI